MSNAPTLVREDQSAYNTDAQILAELLATSTERAERILARTTLEQLQRISPEEMVYAAAVTHRQARTLAAATAYAKETAPERPEFQPLGDHLRRGRGKPAAASPRRPHPRGAPRPPDQHPRRNHKSPHALPGQRQLHRRPTGQRSCDLPSSPVHHPSSFPTTTPGATRTRHRPMY